MRAMTSCEREIFEKFGMTGEEVVADCERILAIEDKGECARQLIEKGYAKEPGNDQE